MPNNIYQLWISRITWACSSRPSRRCSGRGRSNFSVMAEAPAAPKGTGGNAKAEGAVSPASTSAFGGPSEPAKTRKTAAQWRRRGLGGRDQRGDEPAQYFRRLRRRREQPVCPGGAQAVASSPARTYNPLFIYGGVGLGKTHLMHAIGQAIAREAKPGAEGRLHHQRGLHQRVHRRHPEQYADRNSASATGRPMCCSSTTSSSSPTRTARRRNFSTPSIRSSTATSRSSSPATVRPSEIANLETRLVSRFEWGLTAELQAPDIETRVAILRKKAQSMEIKLDPSVLQFLAERIRTNVRRLEGALMRVASYVSLNERAARRTRKRSSNCSRTSCTRKRAARSPSIRSSGAWRSISMCAWRT